MGEALELHTYLPLSFKTRSEQDYIAFLWDAFETNYTHGKYQFAFLAYHMLTMSCVYFNMADSADPAGGFRERPHRLWQGHREEPVGSNLALCFQHRERAQHPAPAQAHRLRQRQDWHLAKLVDDRNDTAHPNGNIFFSTQTALDAKITEVLRVVDEIQTHSRPVIEHAYREFLLQNHDPDEREYLDAADQIREVLIHGNYMSQKDIEICLGFDLAGIAERPEIASIRTLHVALKVAHEDPGVAT